MKRHRHLTARLLIAGAFLALSSSLGANAQGADGGDVMDTYDASDITSDLSNVPDFTPVSPAKPYKVAWQNQLLSYQERFVLTLQIDPAPVDPQETGSITRREK
jgi:hypothetical protein